MDEFCDWLLKQGFSHITIRKHLANVSHFKEFLGKRKRGEFRTISPKEVNAFFRAYPAQAKTRGTLDPHVRRVRQSINRFVKFLQQSGRYDSQDKRPVFAEILQDYLQWMHDDRHANASTLTSRRYYLSQFFAWLGPKATHKRLAELSAEAVEQFFLSYAETAAPSSRQAMGTALRTFLKFCFQKAVIPHPLDKAVPTLRSYKLATVPQALSDEQAQKVLCCVDRSTSVGRRDYAILQLLYTYGVRGGQVRHLQLADIHWSKNQILFKASKRGKDSLLTLNTLKLTSPLALPIQNFIRLRQLCGRDYRSQGRLLGCFDRFLVQEEVKNTRITRQIIERYQSALSHLTPRDQANRLCVVRQLCQYVARNDPNTFIPEPMKTIWGYRARKPYIFSCSEIHRLLDGALALPPDGSRRPYTYHTLLGLLYTTGVRSSEACSLCS